MLSAVLKRVKSLEKRLDKHSHSVDELKNKINGPLYIETSNRSLSAGEVKEILLRYQAKFKEVGFEMNHIKSKMTAQEDSVQKIKLDLIRYISEKQRSNQQDCDLQQPVSCSREQQSVFPLHQGRTQSEYNPTVEFLFNQGSGFQSLQPPLQHSLPNVNKESAGVTSLRESFQRSTEAIVADRCVKEAEESQRTLLNLLVQDKLRLPVQTEIECLLGQNQEKENVLQTATKTLLSDVNRQDPAHLQIELNVCKVCDNGT